MTFNNINYSKNDQVFYKKGRKNENRKIGLDAVVHWNKLAG